jgi:hypothetical protein
MLGTMPALRVGGWHSPVAPACIDGSRSSKPCGRNGWFQVWGISPILLSRQVSESIKKLCPPRCPRCERARSKFDSSETPVHHGPASYPDLGLHSHSVRSPENRVPAEKAFACWVSPFSWRCLGPNGGERAFGKSQNLARSRVRDEGSGRDSGSDGAVNQWGRLPAALSNHFWALPGRLPCDWAVDESGNSGPAQPNGHCQLKASGPMPASFVRHVFLQANSWRDVTRARDGKVPFCPARSPNPANEDPMA